MKPQPTKTHRAWSYSLLEDSCVALLSEAPPTVTFCTVHIHNVVAKKRDASTELLRRLHAYMQQHNLDFIGGDFKMRPVMCLQIQSSRYLAILSCGDSGRWMRRIVSARGFSSCQSDHTSGVWIHMAAINSTHLDLATPRLTFPSSFNCAPPTCQAPTASHAVNKPNKDDLNAKPPGMSDGSGDVDEHNVVYQGHVVPTFPHLFRSQVSL